MQPAVRGPAGRFFFDHTIQEYPRGARRGGYLALAVLATIVLYYVYYTQTGVTPNILAGYHMNFSFYIAIIVVSNLLGAFASLPASQTDRVGRTNVVIYGLLIVGLLTAIGIPLSDSQWSYLVITCLIGIVEGGILVATPALVRDFSPQLGRASAMGFWTMGPVAGSLITSLVALHTLDHFGQTHWKSQFVISGIAAIVVFVISLFFLKDLSPQIRDQLMVSARDQALVEARARGLTDHELLEASEHPWRQILHWDLVLSAFGIALFLLLYYAAASLFTIYYPVIFKNPNGTNFTVTQANGLNTWFWTADIISLIIVGLLSDALKVRKPFMVVGAALTAVMLIIFLGEATHPHTGYYTLAVETTLIAFGTALVFAPWIASYTETVEEKNPALVATGLALWGWSLRIVVGVSFIFLPLVITSVNPIVDNLPVADTVIHGQSISDFVVENPAVIDFASIAWRAPGAPGQGSRRRRRGRGRPLRGQHCGGGEGIRGARTRRVGQVQDGAGEVRAALHGPAGLYPRPPGRAERAPGGVGQGSFAVATLVLRRPGRNSRLRPHHLAGQGPVEAVGRSPRRRRAQCRGGRRAGPPHRGTARQHLSAGRPAPRVD